MTISIISTRLRDDIAYSRDRGDRSDEPSTYRTCKSQERRRSSSRGVDRKDRFFDLDDDRNVETRGLSLRVRVNARSNVEFDRNEFVSRESRKVTGSRYPSNRNKCAIIKSTRKERRFANRPDRSRISFILFLIRCTLDRSKLSERWSPWTPNRSPRGSTAADACAPFADASNVIKVNNDFRSTHRSSVHRFVNGCRFKNTLV